MKAVTIPEVRIGKCTRSSSDKRMTDGSPATTIVVTASRGHTRDTRFLRRSNAALVDGVRARLARAWRDAPWINHYVHDPSGVLRLRYARNLAVGVSFRRRSFSQARNT